MYIYIIDLKNEQICKTIKGYETDILTINKIKFNDKEECLINLDYYGIIKLWNVWFNVLSVCGGDIFEVAIGILRKNIIERTSFEKLEPKTTMLKVIDYLKKKFVIVVSFGLFQIKKVKHMDI